MSILSFGRLAAVLLLAVAGPARAAGTYFEVTYLPSDRPGELQLGVTYTLWVPEGVATLRGVIVHQHGCGAGACKGGETAAYDLHWQALAKKWDCALLGPSYHQQDGHNCRLWCDPRNGSRQTFLKALTEFAAKAKHPELERVPWCLWGHSGGAFWASLMQLSDPERVVAVWLRSGTAFAAWEKGEIPKPEIPAAAYQVPTMLNPGAKEKDDKRFHGAWSGSLAMFRAYRAKGALIGFAPDPRTAHECGDSRYLAIPFFDTCLMLRQPAGFLFFDPKAERKKKAEADQKLRNTYDNAIPWLAPLLSDKPEPADRYEGKVEESVWLPDKRVALAWAEYVKTGAVRDATPPPAPLRVKVTSQPDQAVEIAWDAEADLESGLRAFVIQRDGKDLGQVPEKPSSRFGRPLFQAMSYHDTPERPLPAMRFVDRTAQSGAKHDYRILAVNSVGLRSEPVGPAGASGTQQATIQPALPLNEVALAKLRALKPNQAVLLGKAQVVGEFNDVARKYNLHQTGPMGRDFTIKMVWAPERRRALFCGANHGVPHRLNDVWEFDLSALTWAMLYAPDNPRDYTGLGKDFSDVEFKDGVLITKRGGPAVIAHSWWGLTYDPAQKALLLMNTWVTDQKKAVAQVGGDPAMLYQGPPLWAFFPDTRRWKVLKPEPPYPRAPFGGLLEYLPELAGSVWHTNNWQMKATWLYNPRANGWKDLKANGAAGDFEKQAPPPEQVGFYDPARKMVIVQRHKETFHYDIRANAWKKVLSADKDSEQVPFGHDAYAPMYYDPVSGHGLLVEFKTNTLWTYDPDKHTWAKLRPEGDPMPEGNKRLAYFDPDQNVFVVIHGTTVWAYRYRAR